MLRGLVVPLLVVVFLVTSCSNVAQETVNGSGKMETRDFNLSGFSGIQAATGFIVQMSQGNSYKVLVTADDNLWDKLDISQSGGTLHLQSKPGITIRNATLKAIVTLPSLKKIDLSGAAKGTAGGFNSGNSLVITLSGAGTLNLDGGKFGSTKIDISGASTLSGNTNIDEATFSVSGAGKVNISGTGGSATIDASGGGQLILDQFKVQKVSVTLSGGSQARVNCQNITQANLSGSSYLYYVDNPTLGKIQTSGGSVINKE